MGRLLELTRRIPVTFVLCGWFLATRAIVAARGYSFISGGLTAEVQDLDPALLRHHLLQSLWWLHGQPPLWNLSLGIVLKIFPTQWPHVWRAVFLALGLVETLALYALLLRVGLSRWIGAVIVAAFMVTPPILSYELYLSYDYPTLVLLTLILLVVARFVERPTIARGTLVFATAAVVVLERTLFQIGWMILLAGVLLAAVRPRRTVLIAAAVPLAIVLALYIKNEVMFGVPATSSWTGMGFARIAEHGYSLSARRKLVAQGALHRVSLIRTYSPLAAYRTVRAEPPRSRTGIAALDQVSGQDGRTNLNNKAYITISKEYWHDDLWLVRHHPGHYLRSVLTSTGIFLRTPDKYPTFGPYDTWFRKVVYGAGSAASSGIVLIAAYVLALAYGLALSVSRLRPGAEGPVVIAAAAVLTIINVAVVGNLAELGENYRFRFYTDPLVIVILSLAAARTFRRRLEPVEDHGTQRPRDRRGFVAPVSISPAQEDAKGTWT